MQYETIEEFIFIPNDLLNSYPTKDNCIQCELAWHSVRLKNFKITAVKDGYGVNKLTNERIDGIIVDFSFSAPKGLYQ